jgi:hypothetical protein
VDRWDGIDLGGVYNAVAADPVPVLVGVLHFTCLLIVGRWRRAGWYLGLSAQLLIVGYAIAASRPAFLAAALSVAGYLWLLATRRGETWRAIPTPRQVSRAAKACVGCCIHATLAAAEVSTDEPAPLQAVSRWPTPRWPRASTTTASLPAARNGAPLPGGA